MMVKKVNLAAALFCLMQRQGTSLLFRQVHGFYDSLNSGCLTFGLHVEDEVLEKNRRSVSAFAE